MSWHPLIPRAGSASVSPHSDAGLVRVLPVGAGAAPHPSKYQLKKKGAQPKTSYPVLDRLRAGVDPRSAETYPTHTSDGAAARHPVPRIGSTRAGVFFPPGC